MTPAIPATSAVRRPPHRARLVALALAVTVALLAAGCTGGARAEGGADGALSGPDERDLTPYEGLGAWVDAFDYAPAFQEDGEAPLVTPAAVSDMAALGVRSLYLQAGKDDERSPDPIVDSELVPAFLEAAHEHGIRVVAWFLPRLVDLDVDVARVRALADYEVDGHRFDGVAIDIESLDVPDPAERGDRLVELSKRLDDVMGDDPLGAIVLEPVLLEVVNDQLWPQFPWRDIVDHYDVWLPMSYWTNRSSDSRYHDGYVYTDENIRRLRADLGDDDAPIHVIGGVADTAGAADYRGFVRAAEEHGALGWSVYDYRTQSSASWPHLR